MSAYISPVADDAVTKLQNLLQNTLYSFADITITFAPAEFRALEKECKELGITLPEGIKEGSTPVSLPTEADGAASGPPVPGSLMDRVERLGELNDHIQATVDDLPDTTISKEEIISHVKLLNEECQRASAELESLYSEFDTAFQTLRKHVYCDNKTQ